VIKVRDYEEALTTLNDTQYGLTGASSPNHSSLPAISRRAPKPAAQW